jgi:hypothetical protein
VKWLKVYVLSSNPSTSKKKVDIDGTFTMGRNIFCFIKLYVDSDFSLFSLFFKDPRGKYLAEKILGTCLFEANQEFPSVAVAAAAAVLSLHPAAM